MPTRIATIHAVAIAVDPTREAFREGWPEAGISSLLDDDLTPALAREGGLGPAVTRRICDLAVYAAGTGVDGILFTCSAFTPAMDVARRLVTVPVLKPDEAMWAAALDAGRRIGVVATLPATAPVAEGQVRAAAAGRGVDVDVRPAVAAGAMPALAAGDALTHDRLVVDAVRGLAPSVDVVCLAQFSMARARAAAEEAAGIPVLTSPRAAVARLRQLLSS